MFRFSLEYRRMAASRNFTRCLLYWILRVYACHADVVELVDTYALGAYASRREGSSPFIRTKYIRVTGP